jgi:hypothetical protein
MGSTFRVVIEGVPVGQPTYKINSAPTSRTYSEAMRIPVPGIVDPFGEWSCVYYFNVLNTDGVES